MKSKQVRLAVAGHKIVFAITAAQLEALRDPRKKHNRNARRDPRWSLVARGLLRQIEGLSGVFERTIAGDAVLGAMEKYGKKASAR